MLVRMLQVCGLQVLGPLLRPGKALSTFVGEAAVL